MGFLYELNDIVKTFCLPIIIGIFTFATPLILQTISRVDDKYNSTLLAKLFVKDMTCQAFIWTGVLSFLSILIWILHLPRLVECVRDCLQPFCGFQIHFIHKLSHSTFGSLKRAYIDLYEVFRTTK